MLASHLFQGVARFQARQLFLIQLRLIAALILIQLYLIFNSQKNVSPQLEVRSFSSLGQAPLYLQLAQLLNH